MMLKLRALVWTVTVAALAACAAAPPLEQLDEGAGMTLLRSTAPLVFARTDLRYSRSARDYLYVGPLEVNRQGVREYYLWVGVATTLDRGFIAPLVEAPRTLSVVLDGEPMEFALRPLGELVRRTSGGPVYSTTVPLQAELAARVTLQQLEWLSMADVASLAVVEQGSQRIYVRWQGSAGFDDFLLAVGR
jgi:hypothetical protein